MKKLSIKSTLLLTIALLDAVITLAMAYNAYGAFVSYTNANNLKLASQTVDKLLDAEKALSQERGTAMALAALPPEKSGALMEDIKAERQSYDHSFAEALESLENSLADNIPVFLSKVKSGTQDLKNLRADIDKIALLNSGNRPANIDQRIFDVTTNQIENMDKLIEAFYKPHLELNAGAARQIRFSTIIWRITEYAGREYATLGALIASNKFPSKETREKLATWRSRTQYGWEQVHSGIANSSILQPLKPLMEEAETHYFLTFDQIKDIFDTQGASPSATNYPISVDVWLTLASDAVDSLYAMNDGVQKANRQYIKTILQTAQTNIIFGAAMLFLALLLSFYSWWVILSRVLKPIEGMVDDLFNAARAGGSEATAPNSAQDEMGKLSHVLKAMQEQAIVLQEQRDKANAANVAKDEFMANMSHELRTPMNVVLGLAHILASQPLTEKQHYMIKTLRISAESLLGIINDLLDFSKIERGGMEIECIPFSLRDVIDEAVRLMSVKAQEKNLWFKSRLDGIGDEEYLGDPTRLRQVLINLCGNAIKFTEKGGITLFARSLRGRGSGVPLIIEVEDTGIGIAKDKVNLVFEKFTQADSSISRKYGGTGLGLSISKSLIEKMGGAIGLRSVLGQGTVFTVTLTLSLHHGATDASEKRSKIPSTSGLIAETKPATLIAPSEPETHVASRNEKILIVEDYAPNVMVVEEYLNWFGYSYDVAENGLIALQKYKTHKYHAILMDIQMADMDGFTATNEIRDYEKANNLPRIKIIGMTAFALGSDRERCLKAGMDEYIPKPFNSEELRRKLAET